MGISWVNYDQLYCSSELGTEVPARVVNVHFRHFQHTWRGSYGQAQEAVPDQLKGPCRIICMVFLPALSTFIASALKIRCPVLVSHSAYTPSLLTIFLQSHLQQAPYDIRISPHSRKRQSHDVKHHLYIQVLPVYLLSLVVRIYMR